MSNQFEITFIKKFRGEQVVFENFWLEFHPGNIILRS